MAVKKYANIDFIGEHSFTDSGNTVYIKDGYLGVGVSNPIEHITADGYLAFKEVVFSPPANPGFGKVYVKEDGKLYFLDGSSTEFDLTAAASQVTATQGFDGYVTFFTGSNTIAGDNDFFWDRANNRLGIHTETPQNFLDVAGGMAVGESFAGSSAAPANSLIVDNFIGINTDTPLTSLHISRTGSAPAGASSPSPSAFMLVDSNAGGTLEFRAGTGTSAGYGLTFSDGSTAAGSMQYFHNSDVFTFVIGGISDRVVFNSTGIGYSAIPINALDIDGAAAIGSSYAGISTAPADGLIVEGDVAIGTTSPDVFNLYVSNSGENPFGTARYASNSSPQKWAFRRARGTESSPSDLQDGDNIGSIVFQGYINGGFKERFTIEAIVSDTPGTPDANDLPIDLVFSGNIDGGGAIIEYFRITHDGRLAFSGAGYTPGQINFTNQTNPGSLPMFVGQSSNDDPGGIMIDLRSANNETIIGLKHGDSPGVGEIFYNNGFNFTNASNENVLYMGVDGYVGLKTADPQAHLHVAGDAIFDGYIVANNLTLPETTAPSQIDEHGRLYVNANDNNLHFVDSAGTDFDLIPNGQTVGATGGADGYITFFTGPTNIAGDNDLFWDRANNRLGLHTQTPQNFLDVAGGVAIGSTYGGVESAPEDGVVIEGRTYIRTTNSGAASGSLIVDEGGDQGGVVAAFTGSAANRTQLGINNDSGAASADPLLSFATSGSTRTMLGYDKSESSFTIGVANSSGNPGAPTTSNAFTRMVIDGNTGNIGIGLAYNPEAKLDVKGDGYFDGYLNPYQDDMWGLGSTDRRWSDVTVGPGSVNIISKAAENAVGVDRFWKVRARYEDGYLDIGHNEDTGIIVSPAGDVAIHTTDYDKRFGLQVDKAVAIGGGGIEKPFINSGLYVEGKVLISGVSNPSLPSLDNGGAGTAPATFNVEVSAGNQVSMYSKSNTANIMVIDGVSTEGIYFGESGVSKGGIGYVHSQSAIRIGLDTAGIFAGVGGGDDKIAIKTSGNVGIGAMDPQNLLDVNGAAVIGSTYAGVNTAPADGLLVEGRTVIGATSSVLFGGVNAPLTVTSGNGAQTAIVANNTTASGAPVFVTAISGTTKWGFGTVNDTTDNLRIFPDGVASGRGMTGKWSGGGDIEFGINTTDPSAPLDVRGTLGSPTGLATPVIVMADIVGTPGVGFGSSISIGGHNTSNSIKSATIISGRWDNPTAGSEDGRLEIGVTDNSTTNSNIIVIDKNGMAVMNESVAPRSALDVGGDGYFDGYVVADHFRLPELGVAPSTVTEHGLLYVSSADNNLHYIDSLGTDFDLTPTAGSVSGSGATGQVAFWTASNIVSGENNLYWDSASDRLGIGTATPQNDLDILGGAVIGSTYAGTQAAPTDGLLVTGKVGIGTVPAAAQEEVLRVKGTITAEDGYLESRRNTSGTFGALILDGGNGAGDGGSSIQLRYNNESEYIIYQRNSGTIANTFSIAVGGSADPDNAPFRMTPSERFGLGRVVSPQSIVDVNGNMTIGSTYAGTNAATADGLIVEGFVGIGTPSPSTDLHVNSTSAVNIQGVSSSGDATLQMDSGNAARARFILKNNTVDSWQIIKDASNDFVLINKNGGNTSNTIFADANTNYVGINFDSPEANLHVHGDGYFDGYLNPYQDDMWGLGSADNRWSDVTVGPGSINIISKAAENAVGVDRFWKVRTRYDDGYLDIGHNADTGLIVTPAGDVAIQTTEYDQRFGLNINKAVSIGGDGVTKPNISNGLFVSGQVLLSNSTVPDDLTEIGASADARLVLENNTDIALYIKRTGSGGAAILLEGDQGSTLNFEASGVRKGTVGYLNSDNTLRLGVSAAYPGLGGAADRIVILGSSGNVGIGTATPNSKMDINGSLTIGSTFAGTSAAPTDGLLVEGAARFGQNISIGNSLLTVGDSSSSPRGIVINNSGTGDAFFGVAVGGTILWSIGVDNDDDDKLKIVSGTNPSQFPDDGITVKSGSTTTVGINKSNPDAPLDITRVSAVSNSETILNIGQKLSGGGAGNTGKNFGPKVAFLSPTTTSANTGMALIRSLWDNPAGASAEEAKILIDIKTGIDVNTHNVFTLNKYGLALLKEDETARSALDVGGDGYFDGYVVSDHLRLPELGVAPSQVDEHGLLYVSSSDNNLHYIDSLGTDFDLTPTGSITAQQAFDGYVTFFTGTNTIAGDNDLFWDRENNRLGIHTETPQNFLDVKGSVAIGAAFAGSSAAPANSLIVDDFVGINTDAPTARLHISQGGVIPTGAPSQSSGTFLLIDSGAGGFIEYRAGTGTTVGYGMIFSDGVSTAGAFQYFHNTDTFRFDIGGAADRVIFNASGIGYAVVPTNGLDINGGGVIGSTFAGVETAPTDGLLVEGDIRGGGTDAITVTGDPTLITTVGSNHNIIVGNNSGSGDVWFSTAIGGTVNWSMGVNNDDSDKFRIVDSSNPASRADTDTGVTLSVSGPNMFMGINDNAPGSILTIAKPVPANSTDGILTIKTTSTTPATTGHGSTVSFSGDNSINEVNSLAQIKTTWVDATDGAEEAQMAIGVAGETLGALKNILLLNKDGLAIVNDSEHPRSALDVGGDGYFDGYVVADHLRLPELGVAPSTADEHGLLYVDSSDSDLYYKDSAGGTFNLTAGSATTAPLYTITTVKTGATNANFDEVVRCDPSGGGFTVTLPDASTNIGQTIIVKNTTTSTNTITIEGTGGDTIDGLSSVTIEEGRRSLTFVSYSSTEWGII